MVVWGQRFEREAYFSDKALAAAYAAAHGFELAGAAVALAFCQWSVHGRP